MTRRSYDQACPVATALDVVGERWTLLIVRDLFFGPLRFTDLRDGLPGLAPNLLADRLRFLVDAGLIDRVDQPPPSHRTVYRLTSRGRELGPVVHELSRFGIHDWADPDAEPPPPRLVRGALLSLLVPEHLDDAGWTARLELGDARLGLRVAPAGRTAGRPLDRLRVRDLADAAGQPEAGADGAGEPDLVVTSTLGTLLSVRRGERSPTAARRAGSLRVRGPRPHQARLAGLLGWSARARTGSAR